MLPRLTTPCLTRVANLELVAIWSALGWPYLGITAAMQRNGNEVGCWEQLQARLCREGGGQLAREERSERGAAHGVAG